jgi:hypothetical protein
MKVLNRFSQFEQSLNYQFWIKKMSLPIELVSTTAHSKFWWGTQNDFSAALVGDESNAEVMASLKEIPLEILELGVVDHVVFDRGHWWGRSAFSKALKELIVKRAFELETAKFAYIVGNNFRAISAVMVLIKLGFKNFKTTMDDHFFELLEKQVKRAFGVRLLNIPVKDLLTQPSDGSLLVNTVNPHQDLSTFQDICYFNFLSSRSVVADAQWDSLMAKLTTEGESVGHKTISALEIQGLTDFIILKNFGVLTEFSWEDYLSSWKSFVNSQSSS